MSAYAPVAYYDGYCVSCDVEQPLVVTEHGSRGVRAWLSGVGAEDRELSYTCRVCGRVEHVPATEEDDAEYDATLLRWPDFVPVVPVVPVAVPAAAVVVVEPAEAILPSCTRWAGSDVWTTAAVALLSQPAPVAPVAVLPHTRPVVRTVVPVQRVSATDGPLLARAVA